jgi:hypothetical protein
LNPPTLYTSEMLAFSSTTKILIIATVLAVLIGGYFAFVSRGDTTVGVTLPQPGGGEIDLNRGLIAHYTFDGPDIDWGSSTAEIRDRSPAEAHGDAPNGLQELNWLRPGVIGQGLRISGTSTNTAIEFNHPDIDTQSNGTIAFWIRVNDAPSGTNQSVGSFFRPSSCSSGVNYYRQHYSSSEVVFFQLTDGCGSIYMNLDIPVNAWQTWRHVVITGGGGGNAHFVDGEQVVPHYYNGSSATEAWLDDIQMNPRYYLGLGTTTADIELDDFRIYDRKLSADEVARLYQMGATTKVNTTVEQPAGGEVDLTRGLWLHYTFDGPDVDWSSTTGEFIDRTGSGNTGSSTGTFDLTAADDGVLGQGIRLDGVDDYVESTNTGFLATTTSWSTNIQGCYFIGASQNGGCAAPYYFLNGDIDDVRIYNRALSAEEVKRLYQLGATTKVNTTVEQPGSGEVDLQNGLVGHWTFDGADTLTSITDRSGQGNHGRLEFGTEGNTSTSSMQTRGRIGQALNFDGIDDYIDIDDTPSLQIADTLTVSAWVKQTGFSGSFSPFSYQQTGQWGLFNSSIGWWAMYVNATRTPAVYGYNDAEWKHLVGTYDRFEGTIRFYINGVLTGERAESDPIGIGGNIYIGRVLSGSFRYFPGVIDDIRIYNRALSAEEITALYRMGQ